MTPLRHWHTLRLQHTNRVPVTVIYTWAPAQGSMLRSPSTVRFQRTSVSRTWSRKAAGMPKAVGQAVASRP